MSIGEAAWRRRFPAVTSSSSEDAIRSEGLIPVILAIDIEPDAFQVNRANPEPWRGYETAQRFFAELRSRLEALTAAPAHYLWSLRIDPQIAESYGSPTWIAEEYGTHLKDVQACGDELGVHPHAFRWLPDEGTWLHDFGNEAWVEHCVRMALDGFAQVFSRPCVSFRFGDRFMTTHVANLLERLGVLYDLTAEPGTPEAPGPRPDELSSGPQPDYTRVPREPWVPSEADFRRPAPPHTRRRLRMIPLTSSHVKLGFHPRAYARRIWLNGFRYRLQDMTIPMYCQWPPPDTFDRLVDRALRRMRRPYLAFAIRTDRNLTRKVAGNIETLLTHPAAPRFRFCTPAEALAMLDG